MALSYKWFGTSFEEVFDVSRELLKCGCWQREKCPKSGKLHYQFFLWFKKRIRLSALKKLVGECHAEKPYDVGAAWAYCQKEESRIESPIVFGSIETVDEAVHVMLKRKSVLEIIDERPHLWRNLRVLQELKESVSVPRAAMSVGLFLSGASGTGKSRTASTLGAYLGKDVCYVADASLTWFDPYCGEETVVIEEFRQMSSQNVNLLLRLVDRYPMKVPVKGGVRNRVGNGNDFRNNEFMHDEI